MLSKQLISEEIKELVEEIYISNNQFLYVTDEIHNSIIFSRGLEKLGFDNANSINYSQDIIKMIHPDDLLYILEINQKVFNYWKQNAKPLECSFSIDYRIHSLQTGFIRIKRETRPLTISYDCLILLNICTFISKSSSNENKSLYKLTKFIEQMESPRIDQKALPEELVNVFTERENQILELLIKGLKSNDIATLLGICRNTVDTHRRKMIKKAKVKSTKKLVVLCRDKGYK